MKNIYYLIILLMSSINCKAQNPVLDISEQGWNDINGAYYKDINNVLNPFEGTYLYTNGNTSFLIVLQKKTMSSVNNIYYEDLLIGEYQYIQNGVEKVNTLNNLNVNHSDKRKHNITAKSIRNYGSVGCVDCIPGEKALLGGLVDGASENTAQVTIRRTTVNGQPAITIFIFWRTTWHKDTELSGVQASIPGGTYTLLKQQ